MNITSENLVIVTRPIDDGKLEVLTGEKQRSRFKGRRVFPGGKAEGDETQPIAAIREVEEETGIRTLAVNDLKSLGRLVVRDMRPGQERFGNVWLYSAQVDADTPAQHTSELRTEWSSIDDESLTDTMPDDVKHWWPEIHEAIVTNSDDQLIVHIDHDPDGNQHVVVKRPDIAHEPGEIIREAKIPSA